MNPSLHHFLIFHFSFLIFHFSLITAPVVTAHAADDPIKTVKLKTVSGMTRAELKYYAPPKDCAGALVLCPGWNNDGANWIKDTQWQAFAQKQKLVLIGLSFASENDHDGTTGYHLTEKGSGKLFFEGLQQILKRKDAPVVLFGFSRGGQFVHSLAAKFPERVRAWAITGAGPTTTVTDKVTMAPGAITCGLEDTNAGSSRETFFAGLRAKQRVCWLGVPKSGHTIERRAETWVRDFFESVLTQPVGAAGIWEEGEFERGLEGFLIRVWFPDEKIKKIWEKFR